MGINIVHLMRINFAIRQRLANERSLGGGAGHRQPTAGAIMVDRAAANQRQNVVAVSQGVG